MVGQILTLKILTASLRMHFGLLSVIKQWGNGVSSSAAANSLNVVFPIAFPNASLKALACVGGTSTGNYIVQVVSYTKTTLVLCTQFNGQYVAGVGCHYLCVGN